MTDLEPLTPERIEAIRAEWQDAVVHVEKAYGRTLEEIDIDSDDFPWDERRNIVALIGMGKLLDHLLRPL